LSDVSKEKVEWLRDVFVGISLLRRESASSQDNSRSRRRQAEAILDRAGIRAGSALSHRAGKDHADKKDAQ
jgi:hypothetical protein